MIPYLRYLKNILSPLFLAVFLWDALTETDISTIPKTTHIGGRFDNVHSPLITLTIQSHAGNIWSCQVISHLRTTVTKCDPFFLCLGLIFFTRNQRNQTRDGWVGSLNATSVLCHPSKCSVGQTFFLQQRLRLIRAIKDGLISRETLDMKVNYAEEKQKALVNKLGMLIQHRGDSLNAGASARVKTASSLFSSLSTTTVYRIGAPT